MSDKVLIHHAFPSVYDRHSIALILGSFPSVKSRRISFYYGNKQNRFWKMLYGYFGESLTEDVEERKSFLLKRGVALWDMVESCEIEGSMDAAIRNYTLVDLEAVLRVAPLKAILLNGSKAYELFLEKYADCKVPYRKLPSTSPANTRYDEGEWRKALDGVFGIS